jgi:hypothetical protein
MKAKKLAHFQGQVSETDNDNISEIEFLIDQDAINIEVEYPPEEQKNQRQEKDKCKPDEIQRPFCNEKE